MKFRKRPLVIHAVRWTGQNPNEVKAFVGHRPGSEEDGFKLPEEVPAGEWDEAHIWAEAEGCWMRCPVGHWAVRGVAGEFYPHEPGTFKVTYEPIDQNARAVGEQGPTEMRGPIVGVSAVVRRAGNVLLGLRRGAHGAGTFAFPGGKPRPGEAPRDAIARELLEETGLIAANVTPIAWTDEIFASEGLHFVTLHHLVEVSEGEPVLREPEKCGGWEWYPWEALPQPLFSAAEHLVQTGWTPHEERRSIPQSVLSTGERAV